MYQNSNAEKLMGVMVGNLANTMPNEQQQAAINRRRAKSRVAKKSRKVNRSNR